MLDLNGCIAIIDAMGCRKEIAQGIPERGAGFGLAVKENQGRLYNDMQGLFEYAAELGFDGAPHG